MSYSSLVIHHQDKFVLAQGRILMGNDEGSAGL